MGRNRPGRARMSRRGHLKSSGTRCARARIAAQGRTLDLVVNWLTVLFTPGDSTT
jgi:hypothetical protein